MKIAIIGHKRIPSREGGIEVVVEELATRLVEKGNEVTVYNRHSKNQEFKQKNYKGIKIIDNFTINKNSLNALIYSFIASIKILFKKYDIIHYHALGPSAMLIIPKFFKKKTKIVVTVHGLDWKRAKWNKLASWYLKLGEKIIAKYADDIIVLSENNKKYFKNTYDRETIFIPNGVTKNEKKSPNIIKEKYGLTEDYILFVSRIVPEKGLHYLLEAYDSLKLKYKLVIAGNNKPDDKYYIKIKELASKSKNIIMTGLVDEKILSELYSNASLYVLPSEIEGMSMSLLEAISYECPVLVSDIEENIQLAKKENSFKTKDSKDLLMKLEKKLKTPKKQNINIDNYDWDIIVNKTLDIYKEKHIKKCTI